MSADDLALVIDATRKAGQIAHRYWRQKPKVWDKGDGAGPVSEADLAVDSYLKERLLAARPDYGWLSEETEDDDARLGAERVFIVDPIDGTRSFVAGETPWAVSVAVAVAGKVTAAAVFLPAKDKLYSAASGNGAFLNAAPIKVMDVGLVADAQVLAAKPNMNPTLWKNREVPPFQRYFRPSLAYRLALVGEGRFNAMLTMRPAWEWDIAAGALIVAEAGGKITDWGGEPAMFNNPGRKVDGIVAASPDLHAQLSEQLVLPRPMDA